MCAQTEHLPTLLMKQLFASFTLGDNAGVMELVHPDGEWSFPGDPRVLPWAGRWRGRDFEGFIEACKDALDYLEYTAVEFMPIDADRVVVRSFERCRTKATGRVWENPHVGIVTIKDGLVYSWVEYSDTGTLERSFEDCA